MGAVTSTLDIVLKDDVTANAARITAALDRTEAKAKELDAALSRSTMRDKMKGQLATIGANSQHVDALNKKWEEFAKGQGLAAKASEWTKAQSAEVQRWESINKASIKAVMGEERAHEAARVQAGIKAEQVEKRRAEAAVKAEEAAAARAKRRQDAGHGGGIMGGLVAAYAEHEILHGAHQVLERYQEFDNQRRYAKAVMGLTDEQQRPLVDQALKGGATSRFNDIQWLESQREFAARGYKVDQVLGFTPVAATLATAFDKSMPESVKLIEGAMLGFGKDTSTFAKAMSAAQRTADMQVKASKISGMSAEDIEALYKYAAAPAKMAGLSEERMLAFGAVLKKNNMGGDESGTAFRALAKTLVSPTAGGLVAMRAAGIDFNKYQKAPTSIDVGGFSSMVAQKYGVQLSMGALSGLNKIFTDPKMLGDAAKFTPAVVHFLQGALGGKDAKSLKSIAGLAREYRSASAGGVDTMGLMGAIMEAVGKNRSLANALFGSKQGGRIFAALSDGTLYNNTVDQIDNHSSGYAQHVADERSAGFDGAVKQLGGAIATLESKIGQAWDGGGNGGPLTAVTRTAAEVVQGLAELPPTAQRAATELAAVAAAGAALKTFDFIKDGFGLRGLVSSLGEKLGAQTVKTATISAAEVALAGAQVSVGTLAIGAVAAVALVDYLSHQGRKKLAADQPNFGTIPTMKLPDGPAGGAPPLQLGPTGRGRPPPSVDESKLPGHWTYGRGGFREWVVDRPADPVPQMRNPPTLAGMPEPQTGPLTIDVGPAWKAFPQMPLSKATMPFSGDAPAPKVDTGGIDQAKQKADEAHAALDMLNTPVTPQVNTASLDTAIAKMRELVALASQVSAAAGAAAAGATRVSSRSFHPAPAGNRYSV